MGSWILYISIFFYSIKHYEERKELKRIVKNEKRTAPGFVFFITFYLLSILS